MHQELALSFILRQLESTFVCSRSVSASTKTAQEVCLDRRQVLIAVQVATEFELLDFCEGDDGPGASATATAQFRATIGEGQTASSAS